MPPKPLTEIFSDEPVRKKKKRKKRAPSAAPTYSEYLVRPLLVPVEDRCTHTSKMISRTECSLCMGVEVVRVCSETKPEDDDAADLYIDAESDSEVD